MPQLLAYLMLFLLLGSCRLDTESLTTVDTLARNIPNIVIQKVVYKEFDNNQLVQEVEANEFRVFSKDNLVQVRQGKVKTFRNGSAELEGQAAAAQYNRETENADITGPIEVYYHPEKTRVLADKLEWDDQERLLTSTPEGVVKVQQDNGTQFQGKDFSVDMKTKTISYRKDVDGKLYAEGQTDTKAQPEAEKEKKGQAADKQAE